MVLGLLEPRAPRAEHPFSLAPDLPDPAAGKPGELLEVLLQLLVGAREREDVFGGHRLQAASISERRRCVRVV
jgi:hypothetical protein